MKTALDGVDEKLNDYDNYFSGFPFREVLLKIDPYPVKPVPHLEDFHNISMITARLRIFHRILENMQYIYMVSDVFHHSFSWNFAKSSIFVIVFIISTWIFECFSFVNVHWCQIIQISMLIG